MNLPMGSCTVEKKKESRVPARAPWGLRTIIVHLLVLIAALAATVGRAADDNTIAFAIPAQPLATALIEFSRQAKVQVLTSGGDLQNLVTSGVNGRLSVSAAMDQLLAGTGLSYRQVGSDTFSLVAAGKRTSLDPPAPVRAEVGGNPTEAVHQAQAVGTGTAQRAESGGQTPLTLEQIVVVGSRLLQSTKDSAVPVKVFDRQQIEDSGTASVAEFLNTLPEVSTQTTNTGGLQRFAGATTVQLRGLPAGTTLVLLNGRRVEGSGVTSSGGFFDLNTIPLGAVERIEVQPSSSSAVYGGDALGGVVNIVLKKDFTGVEADARYGGTTDGTYNESRYSLAGGWKSDRWSLTATGTYAENSALYGYNRELTANQNYTAFGGIDARVAYGNPGNVCSANGRNLPGLTATCAGIPRNSTGVGLTPADFAATAGMLHELSSTAALSILAPQRHYGAFISGTYQLLPSVELFTEILFNHLELEQPGSPPYKAISVPATNPYNPFGTAVTVNYLFTGLSYASDDRTDYVRPLLGVRGTLPAGWSWELAGWTSRDWSDTSPPGGITNTANITAALANGSFNPFKAGQGASQSVLSTFFGAYSSKYRGALDSVNGFIRGPLFDLGAGPAEAVVGAEYEHDTLAFAVESAFNPQNFVVRRENEAAFAEMKVPLLANTWRPESGALLALDLALRYDRYQSFGGRVSPMTGIEIRPVKSLLLRGTYSSAFKAPTLYDLYAPVTNYTTRVVNDPLRGGQNETPTTPSGGNPNLKAQTGWSSTVGLVFSPEQIAGLDLSITDWTIHIRNGFILPSLLQIVNNPQNFPGRITRAAPVAGDAYSVGPITFIEDTYANFGSIDEAGVDLSAKWRWQTSIGDITPSVDATATYKYDFLQTPGGAVQNAVSQANDAGNYAPRWKGTAALGWKLGALALNVDGRYTGAYRDVTDRTANPRELGDFWYFDFDGRFEVGRALAPASALWSKTFVAAGIRNITNKMPPYSDLQYGFYGYDFYQYDLQGRLFWLQAGVKF